jgi:hypothetical protein
MYLDVGGQQRIDDPTPEQIAHHLRNLPAADAPFVVLCADDDQYIQATVPPPAAKPGAAGDSRWVEWRQETRRRYAVVPLAQAEEAFLAYRRFDEDAVLRLPWRRLTVFNDVHRRWVFALVIFLAYVLYRLVDALLSLRR